MMSAFRRWVLMLTALVTLVGCDHATKYAAKAGLQNRPPRALLGSILDLRYLENTDVAFNLLRWVPDGVRGPVLITFGILAIMALFAATVWRPVTGVKRAAFVLILAGALGNYVDRVFRGYVVDFIHVPHWPVFNVADILVTAGAVLLCWVSFRQRRDPRYAR